MKTGNLFRQYLDQVRLTWRLFRDPRVALWMKLVGVLPFVYLVFPIDLVPDFIPILGQMDDLAILYAGMRLFEGIVPAYITREHRAAITLRHAQQDHVVQGNARQRDR